MADTEAKWYVAHTYSGYENKVKTTIEEAARNRHIEDQIQKVMIPTEDVVEVRDGKSDTKQHKLFPGYVMIKMVMNDDTWYIVRNTRGVTGFVGPESKPVPLSDMEVRSMGVKTAVRSDLEVGDTVSVLNGAWKGTTSVITSMNAKKQTITINAEMFGRETPVELKLADVKKV